MQVESLVDLLEHKIDDTRGKSRKRYEDHSEDVYV